MAGQSHIMCEGNIKVMLKAVTCKVKNELEAN